MKLNCAQCGVLFIARPSEGRKFCGHECYRAYEDIHGRAHQAVESIHFPCKTCEKPFSRQPGALRSYRKQFGRDPLYCSMACSAVGRKADKDAQRASKKCTVCGTAIPYTRKAGIRHHYLRDYCSSECRGIGKSQTYFGNRPGHCDQPIRRLNNYGYVNLYFPAQGEKGRSVLEHRYVMEQAMGRELSDLETVHHMNGRRDDNRLDNLQLRSGNHGPGGDVSAMVKWAHDFIALYPQFDREGNFTPVDAAP
jgi:hypothetical protein